jgi:hypothetical protein
MAQTPKNRYEDVARTGALVRIGVEPFSYRWLPNAAKHNPHGPGWAFFDDDTASRRKPLSHQTRHAYACARWLLRGQLLVSRLGSGVCAVIRRSEGYYHFINDEWQGPYQWKYTGPDSPAQSFVMLPVRKRVSLFGRLPDLPSSAFAAPSLPQH